MTEISYSPLHRWASVPRQAFPSTPIHVPNPFFSSPSYPAPQTFTPFSYPMYPIPSPRALDANAVAILEGLLGKEQTLCIQVRSLTITVAKLTKDMLATGTACPSRFVKVLKEQVAKLQGLMAMLAGIEAHKKTFPESFVVQVSQQWSQRFSKQKVMGTRKRKSSEELNCTTGGEKTKRNTEREQKEQSKVYVPLRFVPTINTFKAQQIKEEEDCSPRELMNINNLIN